MLRNQGMVVLCLSIVACAQEPVIDIEMKRIQGALPADLSGSWERNYARDDDVNAVLRDAYNRLVRTSADRQPMASAKDMSSLLALGRLAELITRPDVLTISQNEHEISIEREDDFAMLCAFYDGMAKDTQNDYGVEICGWDGEQLVSNLVLPDGLQVTHRFTVSENGQQLRVVTTVSSNTSRVPFSLRRFYTKFVRPPSDMNCVETFSMNRVCDTSEIER
jgi:hypothetical protein